MYPVALREKESQGDGGGRKKDPGRHRHPVEVALDDGRTPHVGWSVSAPEHVREPSSSTGVEKDEGDHRQREDDVEDHDRDCHNLQ